MGTPSIHCRTTNLQAVIAITLVSWCCAAIGQSAAPPSDPQALAFAAKAVSGLIGQQSITSVALTGETTWFAGESESGSASLKALGTNESRIDLALPDGTRTEIRDASAGTAQGKWVNPDGSTGMFAGQNTMTDAVWFFPALGSLAAGLNVVLSYVGLETRNGESVQHLRSYVFQPAPSAGTVTAAQRLCQMDYYLDASSALPVALTFSQHPDDNASIDLQVEVDFSDYQKLSGVELPMHIRKSMNGAVVLDITVTGATFNSGLTLSDFSVN